MLASVNLATVLALIAVVIGNVVIMALLFLTTWRARRSYPLPPELKAAGSRERRRLERWAREKNVAVDPDLARAYVSYTKASMPMLRRVFRLFHLWGAFLVLGFLLANPVAHPILWLFVALALIVLLRSYGKQRRLVRLVSSADGTA